MEADRCREGLRAGNAGVSSAKHPPQPEPSCLLGTSPRFDRFFSLFLLIFFKDIEMAFNQHQYKSLLLVGGQSQEYPFLCSLGNILEKKKPNLILCYGCSFQGMFGFLLQSLGLKLQYQKTIILIYLFIFPLSIYFINKALLQVFNLILHILFFSVKCL